MTCHDKSTFCVAGAGRSNLKKKRFQLKAKVPQKAKVTRNLTNKSHSIHVWCIYLHLVDFYGKCKEIYHTWMLWECLLHMLQDRQKVFQWQELKPSFPLEWSWLCFCFEKMQRRQLLQQQVGCFLFGGDGCYLEWRCFLMEQKSRNV